MRIEHNSLSDFCSDIMADAEHILESTVRVRIDRYPEQDEEITFLVGFHATCVVCGDAGDWLLDLTLVAGRDDETGDYGTQAANGWHDSLQVVSRQHGLKLRPGKIEVA